MRGRIATVAMAATVCLGLPGPEALAADRKLSATVADVRGKCLLGSDWIDVQGRYVYWEIVPLAGAASSPGVARWHRSSQIHPVRQVSDGPADNQRLKAPISFAIRLDGVTGPDVAYRDAMRARLGRPSLTGATVLARIAERDLFEANHSNASNPFKFEGEQEYEVPTGYSVCELEVKYLMNKAEATFERSLFGRPVIKSNATVPTRSGGRSFAEELLNK